MAKVQLVRQHRTLMPDSVQAVDHRRGADLRLRGDLFHLGQWRGQRQIRPAISTADGRVDLLVDLQADRRQPFRQLIAIDTANLGDLGVDRKRQNMRVIAVAAHRLPQLKKMRSARTRAADDHGDRHLAIRIVIAQRVVEEGQRDQPLPG